jgi:hypothetical protein
MVAVAMAKSGSIWGQITWGKLLFIGGLQSTHRQGGLWPNLGSTRLEIMILEVGFDRGSKLSNRKNPV